MGYGDRAIWEQQEGETNRWFQRFTAFRLMGPGRSLLSSYNHEKAQKGREESNYVSGAWRNAAEIWRWKIRAEAWDKYLSDQASEKIESAWREKIMGETEALGRLSEYGRNDIGTFFKLSERWTEEPLPSEEILEEEKFIDEKGNQKQRYLVRKAVLDMQALVDPARSFRVKKFMDSPKNGLSIELYDAGGAVVDVGKHHGIFENKDDGANHEITDKPYDLPISVIAPSFIDVYDDIHDHLHSEYLLYGGRGSTKSSFISLVFIWLIKNNPTMHLLAVRQVKDTLRDSVYAQIQWAINILGLEDEFKCTTSPLEITYIPTGQKIYFRGADEPGKLKSIKPQFGAIGGLWIEELDQLHGAAAVRKIEQSAIRGTDIAYIFKSFNPPPTAANWANKYTKIPKESQFQHFSTYLDLKGRIKWLGKVFVEEAEHLKSVNPSAYNHEYLGVPSESGGVIFGNLEIRKISDDEIKIFDRIYYGLDWGYALDPLHWVKLYYDAAREVVYAFDEFRAHNLKNFGLFEVLTKEKGMEEGELLIADSAEPKSIADLREYGLVNCRGAEKGPDSVRYSMRWLQNRAKIVIDNERCPHLAQEMMDYEYEQDHDGEFISEYPDRNNHGIDAVRYALNLVWRKRGK